MDDITIGERYCGDGVRIGPYHSEELTTGV